MRGLITVILTLALLASPVFGEVSGYSLVRVYVDGGVLVEYRLSIATTPSNVSLRVPPGALMVYVEVGGEPTPYVYDEVTGTLSFPALYNNVLVRVYSYTLTSKEGALWRLSLGTVDFETLVALPGGALLVSVEPRDFTVKLVNNTVFLAFKKGSRVTIEYTLVPATTTTPQQPIQTPQPTPTTQTTPPTQPVTAERGLTIPVYAVIAVIIVVALVAITILILRRRGFR